MKNPARAVCGKLTKLWLPWSLTQVPSLIYLIRADPFTCTFLNTHSLFFEFVKRQHFPLLPCFSFQKVDMGLVKEDGVYLQSFQSLPPHNIFCQNPWISQIKTSCPFWLKNAAVNLHGSSIYLFMISHNIRVIVASADSKCNAWSEEPITSIKSRRADNPIC